MMTSSPGTTPTAFSASSSASVPEPVPTPRRAPHRAARSRSRVWTSGPRTKRQESSTRVEASILGMSDVDPGRAVSGLRELARLTGDDDGAQRVAWTDRGRRRSTGSAASWPRSTASASRPTRPATVGHAARRVRALRRDRRPPRLGAQRRLARRLVERHRGPRGPARARAPSRAAADRSSSSTGPTRRARASGAACSGRAPCAGTLEPDSVRGLTDRDGIALPDALREHGVDLDTALQSHAQLEEAAAYLELHIEQGPVLERMDLPLGAVLGTFGVERHAVRFTGLHAHAGSTPMDVRRMPSSPPPAARWPGARTRSALDDVRATTGIVKVSPGIVTAFNGTCEVSLDQRALNADVLAGMLERAREASRADRRRGGLRGRVGAHLADRADPVQPRPHRPRRRGDRRGRRARRRAFPAARCTTPPRWRASSRP